MRKTTIIDYGMGNINSIKNMLGYLGYESVLSNNPEVILKSKRIILPGVGNFGKAMENIRKLELDKILNDAVYEKRIPILGICLGMQLLLSYSEEGNCNGLNFIPGKVKKFSSELIGDLKVPHMGWDYILENNESLLINNLSDNPRFYFVHSYYAICDNNKNCIAKTDYGIKFDSIVNNGIVFGTQFHPEKSHKYGMKLLKNYMENIDV